MNCLSIPFDYVLKCDNGTEPMLLAGFLKDPETMDKSKRYLAVVKYAQGL